MASPGGVVAVIGGAFLFALAPLPHRAPPPLGHTGGFDEPTCVACHFEFEVNPEGGVLRVEGFPSRYRPGRAYDVRIEMEASDMAVGGFEAAFRFASGIHEGQQAGAVRAKDAAVAVRDSAGVRYAHHTRAGSAATTADRIAWTVEWVAPDAVDEVALHVAANSGNGDDSPLGDWVFVQAHRSLRR